MYQMLYSSNSNPRLLREKHKFRRLPWHNGRNWNSDSHPFAFGWIRRSREEFRRISGREK